jgi:hypothetical protein
LGKGTQLAFRLRYVRNSIGLLKWRRIVEDLNDDYFLNEFEGETRGFILSIPLSIDEKRKLIGLIMDEYHRGWRDGFADGRFDNET